MQSNVIQSWRQHRQRQKRGVCDVTWNATLTHWRQAYVWVSLRCPWEPALSSTSLLLVRHPSAP